jgi:TRAP-type C4-dicarboxylate transport system permease small subunit
MHFSLIIRFESNLKKINNIISKFASLVIVVFLTCMVFILGAQIFYRYVLNNSISWSEEISRYLFLWIVFLGSAVAFRQGQHIRVTTFIDFMTDRSRKIILCLTYFIIIFFLVFLLKYGFTLTLNNYTRGHVSPAMQCPMWLIYAAVPFGAFSILMVTLEKFAGHMKGFHKLADRP